MRNKLMRSFCGQRGFYILVFFVVVLSAFLRLYELGNVPFVADEFLDVNATYGYFKTGEWQAWDFNREAPSVRINEASDERAWIYRWQVAQLYHYFVPTEFTIRFTSALWGVIMTVVIYFVTMSWTKNRWIALMAAFLWAVSIPAIEINRKIRMYSMFAPIFLLFMWSLYQFIEARTDKLPAKLTMDPKSLAKDFFHVGWWYVLPVCFFGALSMHLHPLTGNFVIALFVYFFAMIFVLRKDVMRWRYVSYFCVMIIAVVVVRIARPADWQYFIQTLTVTEHVNYVGHILRNYWHPILGGVLMIYGAWSLLRDRSVTRAGVWVTSVFAGLCVMAIFFWARNVGPQYIFFAQPFGLILAAAGVVYGAMRVQSAISHKGVFMGIILAACILLPNYGYFFEENNTYHITATAETVNYRKVFDYVKRNYNDGDVLITRNFRNYYWSGLDARVYDFGSERSEEQLAKEGKVKKITRAYVEEIVKEHPQGWVVLADNDEDFVEKEAQEYFEENFTRVKGSSLLNGNVRVYQWGMESNL